MGGTSPPMVASRGTSSINRSHWLSFQNGQLTTDKHTQEEECRPVVDDGRGWCLTGWLSGHGARKFSKQSSAAPETQGRGFVVQTTQSVINLPMFVPLSIRGALCVTGCLSEQSDQGPSLGDTGRYSNIFAKYQRLDCHLVARKLTHPSDRIWRSLRGPNYKFRHMENHGETGSFDGRPVDWEGEKWMRGSKEIINYLSTQSKD